MTAWKQPASGRFGRRLFPADGQSFGRRHPAVRDKGGPSLARFRAVLGRPARHRRNVEEVMAVGALNLAPGHLLVAFEMLPAMRAGKLEFLHNTNLFVPCAMRATHLSPINARFQDKTDQESEVFVPPSPGPPACRSPLRAATPLRHPTARHSVCRRESCSGVSGGDSAFERTLNTEGFEAT